MATPHKAIRWSALAPFGRIGHALGFRWVFYFTFPIPFHPLLFHALPLALGTWLLWRAFGPGATQWTAPLWMALILAVPLSVPFLQWILFAFRIHLIQALMLPSALFLLGVAAVRGEEPAWALAIPVAFLALHTAAAIASRRNLRAWEADNRAIEGMARDSGPLPPLLVRGSHGRDAAVQMLNSLWLPATHGEDNSDSWLVQRTDDPELIAWLEEVRDMRLNIFQLQNHGQHRTVLLPGERPSNPLVLEPVPAPSSRFRRGHVAGVRVVLRDGSPLTDRYGRPAPLSWIPGFHFFIALQLGGNAGFVPQYGFLPAPVRTLGKRFDAQGACLVLASALRLDEPSPPPFADPAELRRHVAERLDRRLDPELSALDRLIASPSTWMDRKLDTLLRLPRLYAPRAEELVEALRVGRDARHRSSVTLLAKLIAALPEADFQRVGGPLLAVVNSKQLAGRIVLDEPEPGQPPFDGFRLLIHVPKLYERLGELGERARPTVGALLKLLPHIEALQKAMAKIDTADEPGSTP